LTATEASEYFKTFCNTRPMFYYFCSSCCDHHHYREVLICLWPTMTVW